MAILPLHGGRHSPRADDPADRGVVKPLELFFDLVFVLAITQCTVLMADDPTWEGIAAGYSCSACCGGRGSATPG